MFKRFAAFWIQQPQLTRLFIVTLLAVGILSWFIIPKQYNPSIVVPAFQVTVPAPGFSSKQTANQITKPLENIFMGIPGVDHVYSVSMSDAASVLVAFKVGIGKEEATTRLYNAIDSHRTEAPFGIQQWTIQSIDPDDIPIYSFAIVATGEQLSIGETQTQLKTMGLEIIDSLKTIADTTLWFSQGGQDKSILIQFDLEEIVSRNLDIGHIIQTIQQQYSTLPVGSITMGPTQATLRVQGMINAKEQIERIRINTPTGSYVLLGDIAHIEQTKSDNVPHVLFSSYEGIHEAVTVGVAKKTGQNAVSITEKIEKELHKIQTHLPEGFKIVTIQDEGLIAAQTTNMLLINLFQSILIVSIVLSIFLGSKRALNVAISIPLTLSVVFLFILIIGDNINRITLFALILMLGMLVDDATVVVENISRHLGLRTKTGHTKVEAILHAISEVELGVILSTVTRLLSFFAMFFVTGMMGDYMGPIPKYAIVTMIASTTIALSINPFLARVLESDHHHDEQIKKPSRRSRIQSRATNKRESFGKKYQTWLKGYLDETHQAERKRKVFKRLFWIILAVVVIAPVSMEIFRARMLPKSNQNQIYLRADLPADSSLEETQRILDSLHKTLETSYTLGAQTANTDLAIINNITRWMGTAPMVDFSNLFRGSQARQLPYQISARINLIDKSQRSITSEQYVIQLRKELQNTFLGMHPGVELRLLEDPPGPPTRATFLLEMNSNKMSYETLQAEGKWLLTKLKPTLDGFGVKDIGISDDGRQTVYTIKLDHERIASVGLTTTYITQIVGSVVGGANIGILYDETTLSPILIQVEGKKSQLANIDDLDHILLTTPAGSRIPLSEVATILPHENDTIIYSDDKQQTVYIYGEMGENSVIYPVIGLYSLFKKDSFREGKYTYKGSDFYGFDLENTLTKEEVRINVGGERELTMDTFRDMGGAMILAFLAIYLIMVIQFGSFSLGGVLMLSFLLGLIGVFPGYALLYLLSGEYFSATSMIGVIALAGIVVGNAVLLIEYVMILLKNGNTVKMSLVHAGRTRMSPILITSLTTVLGATTILGDPVRSGVAWAIILGLSSSALLTTIVLPIFLYSPLQKLYKKQEESLGTGHLTY